MKVPTYQLTKNLTLYGLNLRPKLDFKIPHGFSNLTDCRIFRNKIGVRLNYTNASCLVKYSQVGHKHRVCSDKSIERKPKSRFQNSFGTHCDTLISDGILPLPLLVNCDKSQTKSVNFEDFLAKNNERVSKRDYVTQVLPSLDNIQVKMLHEGDAIREKFNNINNIFSNSVSWMNAFPLPSSVNCSVLYNYNCNNNVNEINNRVQSSNVCLENVLCSPTSPDEKVPTPRQDPPNNLGKPSEETLLKVSENIVKEMKSLFTKTMNYKMYTLDLIFENRIRDKVTVGIFPYVSQISLLRILGHIKFAYIAMEILKVTRDPIEGCIKVRWRIVGVSALKSLPFIFTLKSYTKEAAKNKMDTWFDGFSTFYVNQDGLIYKHVADKMMPDEEHLVNRKPSLMSRLAALMGRTLKSPAASPAVTTSLLDEPKDKTPSHLSNIDVKKSSFLLPIIGNKIIETII